MVFPITPPTLELPLRTSCTNSCPVPFEHLVLVQGTAGRLPVLEGDVERVACRQGCQAEVQNGNIQ